MSGIVKSKSARNKLTPRTPVSLAWAAASSSLLLCVCLLLPCGLWASQGTAQTGTASAQSGNGSSHAQEEIERRLKQAAAAHPNSFEANHLLGEFYLQAGRLRTGIPYLELARRLNPSHYVNSYDLALAYFKTGDLPSARRQIRAMLARQNKAELHNLLGDVEEKAGNYVAAGSEYQIAAHMEPSEGYIFDWGNELLLHRGFEPALKVFASGVDRYPQSAMLHVGLGVAYYSLRHYDDAAKALCRATDLAPSDPRPYLILGRMFDISLKETDEVTRRLRRFQESRPDNALANYYYAMSLWKGQSGETAEANRINKEKVAALLKRAKSLDPKFPDAPFQLGVLDVQEQKYEDAVREFQEAVRLKPDLSKGHYHLAQAYSHLGDKVSASREYALYQRFHKEDLKEDKLRLKRIGQIVYSLQNPPSPP